VLRPSLVVDTGLHARHWTRQRAIDYGFDANEVERNVVFPGEARAYRIGERKIIEPRDKATASGTGPFLSGSPNVSAKGVAGCRRIA